MLPLSLFLQFPLIRALVSRRRPETVGAAGDGLAARLARRAAGTAPPGGRQERLGAGWAGLPARQDAGMSTAEYAIGTVAAVAFAGVLYAVVTSSTVQDLLMAQVHRALTFSS